MDDEGGGSSPKKMKKCKKGTVARRRCVSEVALRSNGQNIYNCTTSGDGNCIVFGDKINIYNTQQKTSDAEHALAEGAGISTGDSDSAVGPSQYRGHQYASRRPADTECLYAESALPDDGTVARRRCVSEVALRSNGQNIYKFTTSGYGNRIVFGDKINIYNTQQKTSDAEHALAEGAGISTGDSDSAVGPSQYRGHQYASRRPAATHSAPSAEPEAFQIILSEVPKITIPLSNGHHERDKKYVKYFNGLDDIAYYTGFSVNEFDIIVDKLEKRFQLVCERKRNQNAMNLSFRECFMMTVVKLRHGFHFDRLAHLFNIDKSHCYPAFSKLIEVIFEFTENMEWSNNSVNKLLPDGSVKLPKQVLVLDEIELDQVSGFKALLCVNPLNESVVFASDVYKDSLRCKNTKSKIALFAVLMKNLKCGNLKSGDEFIVNKSLEIREDIRRLGLEIRENVAIRKKAMNGIREFKVLNKTDCFKSEEINKIWWTCCFLLVLKTRFNNIL